MMCLLFYALGLEDGHVPNFWLLLYASMLAGWGYQKTLISFRLETSRSIWPRLLNAAAPPNGERPSQRSQACHGNRCPRTRALADTSDFGTLSLALQRRHSEFHLYIVAPEVGYSHQKQCWLRHRLLYHKFKSCCLAAILFWLLGLTMDSTSSARLQVAASVH